MSKSADFKVLHLIPRFQRGGAERVISVLALRVSHNKALIGSSDGEWINHLNETGLTWTRIPLFTSNPLNALSSIIVLRHIVRQYHIDLIHSHHRFASLVGRTVAYLLKIPFVCTVHDLAGGNRLISRIALGNTVTVFSQAVESHLLEHFGLKREQIYRVPMGIAPVEMPAPAQILKTKRQMGCTQRTPIIGFVGRLVHEKGPDLFLQAVPQVVGRFPEAKFWVVGDGEMRDDLSSLVRMLGISESVMFFGGRDDVYSLMACFDFTVVTSIREGFGLVALESLAHGKPVIATQVGGLPEFVQHEQNGLLVPPGQPATIADAIIRLLDDRDLVCKMGKRGREMVRDRLSLEAMLRGMRVVYQSVMEIHLQKASRGVF